jgi:hypothetical protein
MISICANAFSLNPSAVLAALHQIVRDGGKAVKARAHYAQHLAWENCAILANATEFDPEQFPDLTHKITLGGLPFDRDDTLPSHVVEFLDELDNVVGEINNLALPFGIHEN